MGIYEPSVGPSQMLRGGGGITLRSQTDNFLLFIHITSWGEAL